DGFFQAQLAAGVFRVGQHDDGLASRFGPQLIVAGEIDRVVKIRASAARWDRSAGSANSGGVHVDLRPVESASRFTSVSKLITSASSLFRITSRTNLDAASCSATRMLCML